MFIRFICINVSFLVRVPAAPKKPQKKFLFFFPFKVTEQIFTGTVQTKNKIQSTQSQVRQNISGAKDTLKKLGC